MDHSTAIADRHADWQQQQQQNQQQLILHQQSQQQAIYQQPQQQSSPGLEEAMWRMNLSSQEAMPTPYPERHGEPDCPFYMRTGVCGFGENCKFNHPPNIKLGAAKNRGEYPERVGQPECQYYLKTGTCKFGASCKYHHPRDKAGTAGSVNLNFLNLPLRPGEKDCPYYMRTANCKYGVTCKFNHPQPVVPVGASPVLPGLPAGSAGPAQPYPGSMPAWPVARPPYISSPGITGPNNFPSVIIPPTQGGIQVQPWNPYQEGQQQPLQAGFIYSTSIQSQDPVAVGWYSPYIPGQAATTVRLPTTPSGSNEVTTYPDRPGQPECQYYMRTGECRYGAQCRFHHPRDRTVPSQGSPVVPPSRPGAQPCNFFNRYGYCRFGQACRFDHSFMESRYGTLTTDAPLSQYPVETHGINTAESSPKEVEEPGSREFLGGQSASSENVQ